MIIHRGNELINAILSKPIKQSQIIAYLQKFRTVFENNVITLATPDSIYVGIRK